MARLRGILCWPRRWLLGGDPPEGMRATIEREGGQGIIRVELDPDRKRGGPEDIRSATAAIVAPGDAAIAQQRLALSWTGEDTLKRDSLFKKPGSIWVLWIWGTTKCCPCRR